MNKKKLITIIVAVAVVIVAGVGSATALYLLNKSIEPATEEQKQSPSELNAQADEAYKKAEAARDKGDIDEAIVRFQEAKTQYEAADEIPKSANTDAQIDYLEFQKSQPVLPTPQAPPAGSPMLAPSE